MDQEQTNEPEEDGEDMSESEIRQDLGKILEALREDRRSLNTKLEDLTRKQDGVPILLQDLERRQATALDTIRRDFERMFVPRVEYEPKHQVLLDKIRDYDAIISESNRARDEYAQFKAMIVRHDTDIKEMKQSSKETAAKVIAIIGAAIGILSFAINFLQHISFHP